MTTKHTPAEAAPLTADDIVDPIDEATPRLLPDLSGKRIRAIPYQNCTTVVIRKSDFALGGFDQGDVEWDFRVDAFTVKVGDKISQEAADWLVKNYSDQFEYVN